MTPTLTAAVLTAACLTQGAAWGDPKGCPLYPQHQKFKEPQVTTDTHVTLAVEPITLCSPLSGRVWKSRAYSCQSCPDKSPSVPGVTIVTKPGAELYITLENKLELPNPSPEEVKAAWDKEAHTSELKKLQNDHVQHIGYLNCTSLHTHGLHISPERQKKEGGVTFLRDTIFTEVCPGDKPNKYYFPIRSDHLGGSHWYHPHHHHCTAVQAGGGLHGALIVQDPPNSLPPDVADMPTFVAVISLVDLRGIFRNSLSGIGMLEEQGMGGLWKNLEGPDAGKYVEEDSLFALVNGMWRPQLELITGHWYKFKFIYAAVESFIEAKIDSLSGLACEFWLLAKDGIWLNVAPRKINRIYMAPGNRADVAMKCECTKSTSCDGGLYATDTDPSTQDLTEAQKNIDANVHPSQGLETDLLTQELIKFIFKTPNSGFPQGPLKAFSVTRPCYLVDLRAVDVPVQRQGRLDFWSPMDDPKHIAQDWKVTWTDWYRKFKGAQMFHMDAPAVFELEVGEVYQILVRGPLVKKGGIAQHPLHLHTIPYQIQSLVTMDPYFLVGDWHDTLLHTAGQAVVKLHTDTYTGRYIVHCHILTHEDYGMMTYFDITGEDGKIWKGAEEVDPTCYRQGGKAGWKWTSETTRQAEEVLPTEPHWVKGPPGASCLTACTPYGGCNGLGWPASPTDMISVAMATGSHCTPTMQHQSAPHNPSQSFMGTCDYEFTPYFDSETVNAGNYRCGKAPPYNVARFCPCNKAPAGGTGINI